MLYGPILEIITGIFNKKRKIDLLKSSLIKTTYLFIGITHYFYYWWPSFLESVLD